MKTENHIRKILDPEKEQDRVGHSILNDTK